MTTVVDPLGTPAPVYNRSGTTIATLSAQGTDGSTTAVFSIVSERTVVLVSTTTSNYAVRIPEGADIGDTVEVYFVGGDNSFVHIFPSSGETINGNPAPPSLSAAINIGFCARKTTSTNWQTMICT